jgi:hypothetical protein
VEEGDIEEMQIDPKARASMNCSVFLDPRVNKSVAGNELRTKILAQFMNVPEDAPAPRRRSLQGKN